MKEGEIFSEKAADFAFNLFRRSIESNSQKGTLDGNVFLSPTSISVALAMAYIGADGKTKQQINENLFGKVDDKVIFENVRALSEFLNNSGNGYKLNLANRAFVQKTFELLSIYENDLRQIFHSDILQVDFENDSNGVVRVINNWVSEKTAGKIPTLLQSLEHDTKLVLVNAIYFKGDWLLKFDEASTVEKPFHINANQSKNLETMRKSDRFLYHSGDHFQALSLSYVNTDLCMLFLLPNEKFGLAHLENQLNGKKLIELLDNMRNTLVKVELPKFKLEASFDLAEILGKLGMDDMFSRTANFSKISHCGQLFVSDVIHKAFLEVNEQGSEAAAATAVTMMTRSMPHYEHFIADHPFLFAIVEKRNKTLLFLGHFYG